MGIKNHKYWGLLPLFFFLIIPFVSSQPNITINSPLAADYLDLDAIPFNVSSNDTINNWWFNTGGSNVTFTPNTTLSLAEGTYNLIVFGNASGDVGNSSVTFVVYNKKDSYFDLYFITLFLFFIFIGLGFYLNDLVFKFMSGVISIFIAFEFNTVGFPGMTNSFIITGLTVIFAGIGLYMVVKPAIDQLQGLD